MTSGRASLGSTLARVAAAISVVAVVTAGPGVAPVAGAELVASGWWTSSPVPVAPDAGEGALVVHGGPDEPFSFAAVEFVLSEETPSALNLTVAPGSASTPGAELVVCPLAEPFQPADGGPAGDAPAYDCSLEVIGTLNGSTYSFFVASLAEEDRVAVAILPSAPTDRVVLEAPDSQALGTLPSPATGGDLGDAPTTGSSGDVSGVSDGAATSPSFGGGPTSFPASPTFSPPDPVDDAAGPADGSPSAEEPVASDAPQEWDDGVATGAVPIGALDDGADPLAVILFLVLGGVAATLWFAAGRGSAEATAAEPAT